MEQRNTHEFFLLADHHSEDASALQQILQANEIHNPFQLVSDGTQVIEYLKGHGPFADTTRYPMAQLVLMEWDTPGKNALEVLQWVRDQPHYSMLPIMVWTRASITDAELKHAYSLGLNGCFTKPATREELSSLACLVWEYWKLAEKPIMRRH